jgi:hypothetical protein
LNLRPLGYEPQGPGRGGASTSADSWNLTWNSHFFKVDSVTSVGRIDTFQAPNFRTRHQKGTWNRGAPRARSLSSGTGSTSQNLSCPVRTEYVGCRKVAGRRALGVAPSARFDSWSLYRRPGATSEGVPTPLIPEFGQSVGQYTGAHEYGNGPRLSSPFPLITQGQG